MNTFKRARVEYSRLLSVLHYDPETGAFYWKETRAQRIAGSVAGAVDKVTGYRIVTIDKTPHLAHRLAWFYIHGTWPLSQVDHINREKLDNRIDNLREVTISKNQLNREFARGASDVKLPVYAKWSPPARPSELTAEVLRSMLHYNPLTGDFFWRVRVGNVLIGTKAGYGQSHHAGRRMIRLTIGGKKYHCYNARLAWLYIYGREAAGVVDHINGDPTDDRIANLREATQQQNLVNMRYRGNTVSGLKGVVPHRKKWHAHLSGKYIGTFATAEEAHAAYMAEATRLHGEFARAA